MLLKHKIHCINFQPIIKLNCLVIFYNVFDKTCHVNAFSNQLKFVNIQKFQNIINNND